MERAEEITELKVRPIEIRDDLDALLAVLPPHIEEALSRINRGHELLEVVMDLGRPPEARFVNGEVILSDKEITQEDIDYVVSRISEFGEDNRAGIERTLHRISAIRNRKGRIVGLTCRVGRAVYGTVDIIRDIVESGKSILLLGRPGVGKTTMLREVARILAEKKRVVIVDTSNEIGGDGDIPHPAIGRARRMQVPTPSLQHEVMIEAVENHMPEVIIIDEIGRELEAQAARTIAERGVQLVATAHGETLDNLMMNPTLADLVGGIESVTLSDEEAKRRGTQKTVLERRAPPTFDVVIEIKDWNRLAIHHDVASAVDAILRGNPIPAEIRYRTEDGRVLRERATIPPPPIERAPFLPRIQPFREVPPIKGYLYGIGENKVRQAARKLQVPFTVVKDLNQSDVFLTLKSFYRKRPQPVVEAERKGIPVYVLRSNTVAQIEECLADIFELKQGSSDPLALAIREAEEAIKKVLSGVPMVELSPQSAPIRRQQHLLAAQANLSSYSVGKEPFRRVRIYREQ